MTAASPPVMPPSSAPSAPPPPPPTHNPRAPVRPSAALPKRPLSRTVRIHLTNAQKLELCEYAAAHPALAWDELAAWAAKRFRLRKPISTSTVYHALRRHETLKQLSPHELESRRQPQNALWAEFNARLRDWIIHMADQGLHLDCKIIQAEAHRLRAEMDDGTLGKTSFSLGWFAGFMDRQGLSLTSLRQNGTVVAPGRQKRPYKSRPKANTSEAAPASS